MSSAPPSAVAFLGTRHPHVFHRLSLLEGTENITVVGFFDEDDGVARQFAARTGVQRWSSAEQLLDTRPDLVIVEGLDPQIPQLAVTAAPHTRALLLEKPGAPDRQAMEWMTRELARYPVHVTVGYELHYSEALDRATEVLASGSLGDITLVRVHGGCPVGTGAEPWQCLPDDRGGFLFTEGCHMIELLVSAIGTPTSALGVVRTLPEGTPFTSDLVIPDLFTGRVPATDVAVGSLMYEDVAAGILLYDDKIATIDLTAWEATNWVEDWKIEFYGTNGTLTMGPYPPVVDLFLRNPHGHTASGRHRIVSGRPETAGTTTSTLEVTYRRELDTLIEALRSNSPPSQAGLHIARDVVRVCDALYRSSDAGRSVSVAVPSDHDVSTLRR